MFKSIFKGKNTMGAEQPQPMEAEVSLEAQIEARKKEM